MHRRREKEPTLRLKNPLYVLLLGNNIHLIEAGCFRANFSRREHLNASAQGLSTLFINNQHLF